MPNEKFVPPSDAVEVKKSVSFVPPSDAVEKEDKPKAVQPPVKKKKLESPSVWEGIMSSVVPSVKEEQQPAASSSVKKAETKTSLEQELSKINSFMKDYDWEAQKEAQLKANGQVERKLTPSQLRNDPRTPKLTYNNNEYRINRLTDGTESWEKKDKLSGDFFVISDPNSITLLNKKLGGKVPIESPLFEETRKSQLERRQALLPLNQGLIGRSEEQAVPRVKTILANLGVENDFTVEQIGGGYDALEITNKVTGQKQRISLDNWTDERDKQESKVLKSFIESYTYNKDYLKKKKQIDELSIANTDDFNAFDIEGMVEKNKKLNDLKEEVANIEKGRDRFINDNEYRATAEKNVQNEINNYKTKIDILHIQSIDLKEAAKSLNEEKDILSQVISAGTISQEEAQARLESIQKREYNLRKTKENISSELQYSVDRKEFNENVVKDAYLINSERGNILSGTTQAFTRGMEAPFRMILNAYERQTGQKYVGGDKSIFGDDEYGWGAGVSTLDYTKSENRGDFSKAIFGISESLGSALSGYLLTGGAMGIVPKDGASLSEKASNLIDLGIFASMYNSSRDQMEGEDWAGVPLEEKVFLSIAIATPQMILEKFGLNEALRGTNFGRKLTNNILKQVFNEVPKDAASDVVEKSIKNKMVDLIKEGVLRANAAGIVEATTEGSQYLSEVSTQEIYNLAKEKEFFDVPNNFMELVENIGKNAKLGYIGGASLGAVASVASIAREKITKDDFSKLENTINDVNLNELLTLEIQKQVVKGKITQEEANKKLENIQKFKKELAIMPKDMPIDDKFEASNLLAERANIEAEIKGKEKTLIQDKLDRINEINNQLKEIGNRKQAVTEDEVAIEDKETNPSKYDSDGNLIKGSVSVETPVLERLTIQSKNKETEAKIKRKDLFYGVGDFSTKLGGSDKSAIPISHKEINGIEFVEYAHPETGSVDVIVTGKSENDFVGFYRIYENGKPTNKWSSKFENQSRNKANFKTMISGVQEMLPKGHEYTEKTSISTDGLRVWNQQLDKGYEVQRNKDGNIVTDRIAVNGDAISNELGIEVSKGNFRNISVTDNKQFETVKKALTPYLEKLGLTSDNIYWENGTVTIDLPVLKQQKSSEKSAENQKKVEQYRADERAELAEAIPNIDDYKVDGEIDKKKIKASEDGAKYQEIYDKYDKLITPLLTKKEVVQKEEDVLVPTEELDILKEDIEKRKDEGSLGINLGEKVFMGDTPGTIRIDPSNENTIVFETNDKIIELGNVDEVGDLDIASFGLSLFPPTGTLVTGDTNAITYNGKNYKIIGRRRDKKGKAVVRVKDLDTGLEKRIIGQDAENILKDYALSKEKKVQPLKLNVEQKETPVTKKSEKAKKENPVNVDSTLEDLAKEEERLRQEAIDFENSLAEDISKESKKESNLIFSIKGNEFSVTLKPDGTFSVSQKNDKGKFVGIKDQAKRDLAINEYKKIKNDKDTSRLKDAEELSSMFKKEQEDKILNLLNKAIKATSSNGRAFDATLGVPIFVANTALKIVKEAYLINKNILESIKKGYEFISKNGYKVSEYDFKKFVYDNINEPTEETKQEKEVKSPSAKKILGIKDKKVTVTERVALKDQLRLEAKAARESAMNIKKKQRALIDAVKAMEGAGKITPSQSSNLLRRLAYLNVDNVDTTQDFLDYAERLFANAEYSDKVDKGFKAKAKIKAKLKSKNQAPVTQVAKDFATIDPSLVEDIDKYNEMADAMLAAIAPSVSGVKKNEEGEYEANNKLKTPIVIADVQAYVEKALKAQKEIEKQRLLSYYKKLVDAGILNDKMSIEEIREVVANENNDEDKLTAKERAKIVMDDLKERFEVAKSAIEDILGEKVNVERDEEIDALNDDETYTLIYPSKDEIPEFLKDSVSSFSKTTARKGLFGKKKTSENYKVVATGKKIKEKYYSFEKQNEDISKADREIIQRLMSLDLTDMKIKDAMALVDAANNFITNGITAGLRNEVPLQEGDANMKELADKGFVAKSVGFLRGIKVQGRKLNTLGKAYATQIMSITAMADTIFGQDKGVKFLEKIGYQKLSQGVSKAKTIGSKIIDSYVKEFSKTKPNGQKFNTPFNTYERGVYAALARTVVGTDADKKAEFDRKLKELKNSAEKLIKSNEPNLIKKGNMYNEIIEKLGLNGENVTINTVIKNADAKNIEAVDWWINEWQQHYSDLYDTSLAVYNVMLGKDENYTPDRFSKIDQSNKEGDLGEDEGGAFATSMNLEKSKSGVLMESKKKPAGENRYLDIDFDSNNKAALEEALIDIYTAEAIRQIRGAVKSESFKKVIPESDVRKRFVDKIDRYIKIKKGKGEIQDEDARKLERSISLISKYATGRVLGSIASFPAQAIPPLLNTLINARRLDFRDSFNPDAIQWMIDNGASSSMRGLDSLDNIKRVNEKGLRQAGSTFDSILSGAEKVSDFWLNQFLVKGDKYAATASWLTYYKQSLKKQGQSTDVDWKNHEVNKDAFAYANYMVDKNQNPSDSDATGQIYSTQKPVTRVLRNIFIPFSGFSMNQKVKLHSDAVNVLTKGNTADSIRSFTATVAEMMAFHSIKLFIQLYLYKLAVNALLGDEDDEEYKKAKADLYKNAYKQMVQDFASPAPIFDFITIKAANAVIDKAVESELTENNEKNIKDAYEKDKESRILKKQKEISYDDFKTDYIKTEVEKSQFFLPQEEMFGGTVATAVKTTQLTMDMYDLAINKKIAFKNPDGTYTYKEATGESAQAGKWGLIAMLAHQVGALPGDAASMSRMILKRSKPTAVRTNIKKVADDFKRDLELKELTQYQKDMIKSGTSLDKMIETEYKITLYGGLNTPKKQEYFKKITDVFGKNIDLKTIVIDINSGIDTKKIISDLRSDILSEKEIKDIRKESSDIKKEVMKEVMIDVIKNSRK